MGIVTYYLPSLPLPLYTRGVLDRINSAFGAISTFTVSPAMALCACFLLVSVALVQALPQHGTYVPPKQATILPKQECGSTMIIGSGWQSFTSPGYPDVYFNFERCVWRMIAEDPLATLEFQCEDFDVEESRNCRNDKLIFRENIISVAKTCGQGYRQYLSHTDSVKVIFRTNGAITAKGFSCRVRIYPCGSLTSTVSTGNTPPATTPPATTPPATTPPVTTRPATTPPATTPPATTPPTSDGCKCGLLNNGRIVGGVEVNPQNKINWQVGIKYSTNRNYWCGGSIINTDYVLSAAHCFADLTSIVGLGVGVADHNMYSTTDDVSVTRFIEVERVIIHPGYDSSNNDNDIALLKLKEKLDFSPSNAIGPVCLPADDSNSYEGMMGLASGWGTTSSGGSQPSVLQEVTVPILDNSCMGISITPNMVCAGLQEGGKDTCQGDSGGPLAVAFNGRYEQVGITSWGYGCAGANSPGVYARVSEYIDWIMTNTADATYCP